MVNFFKLIISAIQIYINKLLKNSTADWNQSDKNESNYIKNRTHWSNLEEKLVLKKTTLNFSNCQPVDWGQTKTGYIYESIPISLKVNQEYKITFDGKSYSCIAFLDKKYYNVVIGNGAFVGDSNEDTGLPFAIGNYHSGDNTAYVIVADQNIYDISISSMKEEVHKIDVKYLPDDIGIQSDWEEQNENSKSYILNKPDIEYEIAAATDLKLDKENPSGTGSLSLNRKSGKYIGEYSAATGYDNIAAGNCSTTIGKGLVVRDSCTFVEGSYNTYVPFTEDILYNQGGSRYFYSSDYYYMGYSYTFDEYSGKFVLSDPIEVSGKYLISETYVVPKNDPTTMYYLIELKNSSSSSKRFATDDHTAIPEDANAIENTYAHILGNGTSNNARSNAHTIDWDGNAWFAGDVYVGGISQNDESSEKLITENSVVDYVDNKLSNATELAITDSITGIKYFLQIHNAELVSVCKCKYIQVIKMPTKTVYTRGEYFDPTDMEVIAVCEDGTTREISGYTYSDNYLSLNDASFIINYTEFGESYSTTINLTVNEFNAAEVLVDFSYVANDDGTFYINTWKGTLNGEPSTEIIVPDNALISV